MIQASSDLVSATLGARGKQEAIKERLADLEKMT